jgi:hypothetical protein
LCRTSLGSRFFSIKVTCGSPAILGSQHYLPQIFNVSLVPRQSNIEGNEGAIGVAE